MTWKKGDAPWEKQQSFAKGAAPWEQVAPNAANVVQEMPDYISTGERAIAKNFANSPESQLAYYKQEHPDKDFQLVDGEVVTKNKGDVQWRQIDPKFQPIDNPVGTFKDLGHDALDAAYDIPAGIGQGLATTAGFVAGAPSVVGAPLAAAGASAAYGAGAEALRQGIGKYVANIPQDVNGKDVAFAGALGAVSPSLFGVNKLPAMLDKKGLFQQLSPEIQNQAQGLISKGANWLGPKAVEFATGIPGDVQSVYKTGKDRLRDVAQNNEQYQVVEGLMNKVQKTLGKKQTELGQKVGTAIDSAAGPVDITGAKQVFKDRIAELEAKAHLSPVEQREISALKNYYHDHLGLNKPYETFQSANSNIPGSRDIVPFNQSAELGPRLDGPSIDMQKRVFTEWPDQVKGQRAFDLQQKLKDAAAWETNMTSATKSAKGSARGAYMRVNDSLDKSTSGLSKEAKDQYALFKRIGDEVESNFSSPQRTYNTATNLDKNTKMSVLGRLNQLSDSGALNISPEVGDIRALNAYHGMGSSPYIVPKDPKMKTGMFTLMSALGGLAGYNFGSGAAALGAAGGGAAAKGLSTRAAARAMSNIGQQVDKASIFNYLANPAYYQSQNPWGN